MRYTSCVRQMWLPGWVLLGIDGRRVVRGGYLLPASSHPCSRLGNQDVHGPGFRAALDWVRGSETELGWALPVSMGQMEGNLRGMTG